MFKLGVGDDLKCDILETMWFWDWKVKDQGRNSQGQ